MLHKFNIRLTSLLAFFSACSTRSDQDHTIRLCSAALPCSATYATGSSATSRTGAPHRYNTVIISACADLHPNAVPPAFHSFCQLLHQCLHNAIPLILSTSSTSAQQSASTICSPITVLLQCLYFSAFVSHQQHLPPTLKFEPA